MLLSLLLFDTEVLVVEAKNNPFIFLKKHGEKEERH